MRSTIGDFLLTRLKQAGAAHVIGVPGDYNLQFLEQIPNVEGLSFIGTCNELNAAYAADGYARINGIAALLTTYGVGELSALNGVAGACAEHVPVVCITGAPPLYATRGRWLLHHSLADGNFDNMANCYQQFTAAQALLTPANAVDEIDRVLRTCIREKRPVYIQIPSDISFLTIEVPDEPFDPRVPSSDPERLDSALAHIVGLLDKAAKPALLVDLDADRFGLAPLLRQLVDKAGIPYAALSTGKAILAEDDPLWLGQYSGRGSAASVKERIEQSDFLITTTPRFIEGNSGLFTQSLPPATTVNLGAHDVTVGGQVYQGIVATELLARLLETIEPHAADDRQPPSEPAEWTPEPQLPLTQARLWPHLKRVIQPYDVVIAEAGTSAIALGGVSLPAGATYIASNIWGAIGYTLPALLGTMLAAPDRRHILFIGDGSFQLTAQELSTVLRLDFKPIIFLLNNRGYTIERFILGMESSYNDVANWRYTDLPAAFAPDKKFPTFSASTEGELEEVLRAIEASDEGALVELHLNPFDAPEGLKKFGPATADFDYGPRGPQTAEREARAEAEQA